MTEEQLHEMFAKVVDASFDFTMAFNTHGANSVEAHAAHASYMLAMKNYQREASASFLSSIHWDSFCHQHPEALECRLYDV